ncbi:MAG TPA: hypothetical protein VHW45_11555 [Candidatus Sulfotelmatobacter sp.]|jgi:hypothetical protein|nr:hypothetical protein [Candidatus Sulfotelmatobacter sp.]
MFIEKLLDGVVEVQTPIGPRYLMPSSFLQRMYLLWMFRNFTVLPQAVLNPRQKRLIERMCGEQGFVSRSAVEGIDELPIIGTVERSPVVGAPPLPPRRPAASESGSIAAEVRQQP